MLDSCNTAPALPFNTAHVLRLRKADVRALTTAHVLRSTVSQRLLSMRVLNNFCRMHFLGIAVVSIKFYHVPPLLIEAAMQDP